MKNIKELFKNFIKKSSEENTVEKELYDINIIKAVNNFFKGVNKNGKKNKS